MSGSPEQEGFPVQHGIRVHWPHRPVIDLVEMGQYADADRDTLLQLTIWLATSLRSCRDKDAEMALEDWGPLSWAPVQLSEDNIEFDTSCLKLIVGDDGDIFLLFRLFPTFP